MARVFGGHDLYYVISRRNSRPGRDVLFYPTVVKALPAGHLSAVPLGGGSFLVASSTVHQIFASFDSLRAPPSLIP